MTSGSGTENVFPIVKELPGGPTQGQDVVSGSLPLRGPLVLSSTLHGKSPDSTYNPRRETPSLRLPSYTIPPVTLRVGDGGKQFNLLSGVI